MRIIDDVTLRDGSNSRAVVYYYCDISKQLIEINVSSLLFFRWSRVLSIMKSGNERLTATGAEGTVSKQESRWSPWDDKGYWHFKFCPILS